MLLICITIKNEAFKRVLIVFTYRKIPKISPGAFIFERPFWRSLFLEGLIHGGKFASQNRLGYPYSWKKIYSFWFVLLCIWGQFLSASPPGGLYLEGRFNGGFSALRVWGLIFGGAYIWTGLFSEFYGIYKGPAFLNLSSLRSLLLSYCLKPFLRRPYGHLRPLQGPY